MTGPVQLSTSADVLAGDEREGRWALEDVGDDRVALEFDWEAEPTCQHCGEAIEDEGGEIYIHTESGEPWCDETDWLQAVSEADDAEEGESADPADYYESTFAEPVTGPATWCNSAAISVSEEEDSVSVLISVGDPRGAFAMTVRKINRSGYCRHCGQPIVWDGPQTRNLHADGFPYCYDQDEPDNPSTTAEPDGERMILHVPYEGMGWEHMPLKQLHEGTFLIGAS